jgi:hypothetical protein
MSFGSGAHGSDKKIGTAIAKLPRPLLRQTNQGTPWEGFGHEPHARVALIYVCSPVQSVTAALILVVATIQKTKVKLVHQWALTRYHPLVASFVPDFLQLIAGEHIADLEIGIGAGLAQALVEPANVTYSREGFLIQLSGIRQRFESCSFNLATHQFMIRK